MCEIVIFYKLQTNNVTELFRLSLMEASNDFDYEDNSLKNQVKVNLSSSLLAIMNEVNIFVVDALQNKPDTFF